MHFNVLPHFGFRNSLICIFFLHDTFHLVCTFEQWLANSLGLLKLDLQEVLTYVLKRGCLDLRCLSNANPETSLSLHTGQSLGFGFPDTGILRLATFSCCISSSMSVSWSLEDCTYCCSQVTGWPIHFTGD